MDIPVLKTETLSLLYLIHPYINQEQTTKPRISILRKNLNIFHPREELYSLAAAASANTAFCNGYCSITKLPLHYRERE